MTKRTHHTENSNQHTEWNINKPVFKVPSIIRTYFFEGTRMYECSNGREYVADVYDRTLRPPKLTVLSKREAKAVILP